MRKVVQKTSFLGGEAGFLLEGRSDLAQFQLGKDRGQNFVTLKGGGDTRRPGTRYVKNTQGDAPARLFPFIISFDSGTEIYVLEIAVASATSLTMRVIRVSDNSVYTPANSPLTVATGFFDTTGAGLDSIQVAQNGSSLFVVSQGFAPQIVQRTAATPTFSTANYIGPTPGSRSEWFSFPYLTANILSTATLSIDIATVGTGRVVTAGVPLFDDASVVGKYYRMKVGAAADGYFVITGWTDIQTVTVSVLSTITTAATATSNWSEGAWHATKGWPRTVTSYNQRLVMGGTTNQPDTFWMSQVGDAFQMSAATAGIDDPLQFTLASNRFNQIRWMVGGKKLTVGTSSSEWVGTVTNDGTNLFVQFDEETTHGSAPAQSYKSGYAIPFIQRSGRTIREIAFNFTSDSYEATDLTLFGSHVGEAYGRFVDSAGVRVAEVAYQESPFNVLWARDSFGRLYGLTRDKQQQIAAWHTHVLGGVVTDALFTGGSGADYPAMVKSICPIPDANGRLDRLWMVVRRSINGANAYHVEYIDDIKSHAYLTGGSSGDIKAHLDCATIATAASTVTWSGYTRFPSTSVYVIAEDANGMIVQSGLTTVSAGGVITLNNAATKLTVGLHVDAYLRLLPLEGGDAPQINMRSLKRIDTAALRLHETWGLRIGKNRILRSTGNETNTTFEPIPFVSTNVPTIDTFTGIKEVPVPCDAETDGSFTLAMQEPWPCTILSISSRVVSNEV